MWRSGWARSKAQIAERLANGDCGGSYGEAVLILCAALNALAAEVWPGEGKDRKRFVQLLQENTPPTLEVIKISIPLLLRDLRADGENARANQIETAFGPLQHGHILIGDEVDKSEVEILGACPDIELRKLRQLSYANLLYREVRSAYSHEYKAGSSAESFSQTTDPIARVSYVGSASGPDRNIHFHIRWILTLLVETAAAVDCLEGSLPCPDPARWWLEG